MSPLGQTEKYSARADIFRSSSNNGRWFSARKGVTQIDGVGAFDMRISLIRFYGISALRSTIVFMFTQLRLLKPSNKLGALVNSCASELGRSLNAFKGL